MTYLLIAGLIITGIGCIWEFLKHRDYIESTYDDTPED